MGEEIGKEFSRIMQEKFKPLFEKFGFVVSAAMEKTGWIEFQKQNMVISIVYDYNRSYEIDVSFQKEADDPGISIWGILDYERDKHEDMPGLMIFKKEVLIKLMDVLFSKLESIMPKIIADKDYLTKVYEFYNNKQNENYDYDRHPTYHVIVRDADKGWENKNFRKVMELYNEIPDECRSERVKRRVEYLKKRLS